MSKKIDLHLHTRFSDGYHPPAEVIRIVHRGGISVAAITDHDTVDGIEEARAEADRLGIRLITGTELSVEHQGQDLHILAYFIDTSNRELLELLASIRLGRLRRLDRMVERLQLLGIPVEAAAVTAKARSDGAVGRVHLANTLVENRWVAEQNDAFRYYIGNGGPAHVDKETVSLEESLRILLQAGGVPVLAHPGTYDLDGLLEQMVPAGLQGLEIYHASHTPEQIEGFQALAERWDLLATGGSDYHGGREGESLPGERPIDIERLGPLEDRRDRIGEILSRMGGNA